LVGIDKERSFVQTLEFYPWANTGYKDGEVALALREELVFNISI